MSIDISLGDFHRTHEVAHQAESLIENGMRDLSIDELREALRKLRAGQRLTDAETGNDFMYATSYRDSIQAVEEELASR